MTQKWHKNDTKMTQKSYKSDTKITQKWNKNDTKVTQKWYKNDTQKPSDLCSPVVSSEFSFPIAWLQMIMDLLQGGEFQCQDKIKNVTQIQIILGPPCR